ncbi:hypothetical protein CJ178_30175 [Rhodococcus sp. ACPA4]|nr:hypothetical protein CJ178_30175 [Rhodococcus sp. ACPA4]
MEHPRRRPQSWSIPLVRNQPGPRLFGLPRRTTGTDRRSVGPTRSPRHQPAFLSEDERIQVADLRHERLSIRQIATQLNRSPSTISRELRRTLLPSGTYRPHEAHRRAVSPRARHRQRLIESSAELFDTVSQLLGQRWSPQQISRHLTTRFPTPRWLYARFRPVRGREPDQCRSEAPAGHIDCAVRPRTYDHGGGHRHPDTFGHECPAVEL